MECKLCHYFTPAEAPFDQQGFCGLTDKLVEPKGYTVEECIIYKVLKKD